MSGVLKESVDRSEVLAPSDPQAEQLVQEIRRVRKITHTTKGLMPSEAYKLLGENNVAVVGETPHLGVVVAVQFPQVHAHSSRHADALRRHADRIYEQSVQTALRVGQIDELQARQSMLFVGPRIIITGKVTDKQPIARNPQLGDRPSWHPSESTLLTVTERVDYAQQTGGSKLFVVAGVAFVAASMQACGITPVVAEGIAEPVPPTKTDTPPTKLPTPIVRVTNAQTTPRPGTPTPPATATETKTPNQEVQVVLPPSIESVIVTLAENTVEPYLSVPFETEAATVNYLGSLEAFQELSNAVLANLNWLPASLGTPDGLEISLPSFMEGKLTVDDLARLDVQGVLVSYRKVIDRVGIQGGEGKWQIQAEGYPGGGWDVRMVGPDGKVRIMLPRGETLFTNAISIPSGLVDLYSLPGQGYFGNGELGRVNVDGARHYVVYDVTTGKLMGIVDSKASIDIVTDATAFWRFIDTEYEANLDRELNFDFVGEVNAEQYAKAQNLWVLNPDSIKSFEEFGYPLTTYKGSVVSFEITSLNGAVELYINFLAPSGVITVKPAFIAFNTTPGNQEVVMVNLLDRNQAQDLAKRLDEVLVHAGEIGEFINYLFVFGLDSTADQAGCVSGLGSGPGISEMCHFDPGAEHLDSDAVQARVQTLFVPDEGTSSTSINKTTVLESAPNMPVGFQLPPIE